MHKYIALAAVFAFLAACNLDDEPTLVGANNSNNTNNTNNSNNSNNSNNTNNLPADCAGTPGGDAVEDNCGVCDSDPSNDCAADCAGEFGGDAVEDMCGVCDADPSNDCVQDCAGEYGGDAVEDMCGVCDADPGNDCVQDCNGEYGGDAVLDACGRCVAGETGLVACPTATLTVVEDAHVSTAQPDANFGQETELVIDRTRSAALIKFDLNTLPNDIVIRGLTLRATASGNEDFGGSGDVSVYFASDDRWTEATVTENTRPIFSDFILASWNVANDPVDMDTTYEIIDNPDLIESFQGQVWGDRTVTLYISSPGYRSNYYSSESPDAAKHFTIDIAYQILSKVDLPVVADASVDKSKPTENFGSASDLQVDPRSRTASDPPETAFVRFDLSNIPANVTIERAALEMTAFEGFAYGGNGNCYTYLVDDDTWDESSITWDTQPTFQTDGIGFWWLWYDTTARNQTGINASDLLVDPVRAAYQDDKLISFRLASSGYRTHYRSREHADPDQHPKLTVYFTAN